MKIMLLPATAIMIAIASCCDPVPGGPAEASTPATGLNRKDEKQSTMRFPREDNPALGRGIHAPLRDFPANYVFRSGGLPGCTSVLVGSRALLTAAHCVSETNKGSIERNNTKHTGTCERAPGFMANPADKSVDLALCRMEPEITGIKFESLGNPGTALREDIQLLRTGFGCEERFGRAAEGGLQKARSTIESLPATDNFIRMGSESDLCSGDSGGPAYLLLSDEESGPRLVVGVNAQSGTRLASVTTQSARNFITGWAAGQAGAPICGISQNARNCRN